MPQGKRRFPLVKPSSHILSQEDDGRFQIDVEISFNEEIFLADPLGSPGRGLLVGGVSACSAGVVLLRVDRNGRGVAYISWLDWDCPDLLGCNPRSGSRVEPKWWRRRRDDYRSPLSRLCSKPDLWHGCFATRSRVPEPVKTGRADGRGTASATSGLHVFL